MRVYQRQQPDRQAGPASPMVVLRFGALAEAGINIEMISTSEIRISVVVDKSDVDIAVAAVHAASELGDDQERAIVYGRTGR